MAKRTVRTETAARHDFVRACAFIGIFLSAVLFVVGAILNWCGLGSVASLLNMIAQLALLFAVAFPAWDFVKNRKQVWRVIYWISLVLYVFGCVFGIIGIYIK